jgi:cyclic pyranopterin phosphate synthase
MRDNYGRLVNNMRISVTQQCNLDCFYCHHEGENDGDNGYENNGFMTADEIEKITQIASMVGIEKLKITGGEPLLRNDIVDIVKRTAKHMKEVSMTTNGILLNKYAEPLKEAGLDRVNISFDGLNSMTFQRITNKDAYNKVKQGVSAAVNSGLSPVKLNMVILKGINEEDIPQAIEFSSNVGAILQIIEFEGPREQADDLLFQKYYMNLKSVEKTLEDQAIEIRERQMHCRKKYIVPSEYNGKAEVEIVRAMHNSQFCGNCTRLRVTSSGELKPCLLKNSNLVNIIGPIRNGASDDELMGLMKMAILNKEPYWRT